MSFDCLAVEGGADIPAYDLFLADREVIRHLGIPESDRGFPVDHIEHVHPQGQPADQLGQEIDLLLQLNLLQLHLGDAVEDQDTLGHILFSVVGNHDRFVKGPAVHVGQFDGLLDNLPV